MLVLAALLSLATTPLLPLPLLPLQMSTLAYLCTALCTCGVCNTALILPKYTGIYKCKRLCTSTLSQSLKNVKVARFPPRPSPLSPSAQGRALTPRAAATSEGTGPKPKRPKPRPHPLGRLDLRTRQGRPYWAALAGSGRVGSKGLCPLGLGACTFGPAATPKGLCPLGLRGLGLRTATLLRKRSVYV